jgi:hypothetical protein
VSFTTQGWSFSADSVLNVSFFSPAASQVVVYGREVEVSQQYWMESRAIAAPAMRWSTFGPWPARAVLGPQRIDPANLAIAVRPSLTAGVDFLPALVNADGRHVPREVVSYRLFLRSRFNLREVRYELTPVGNSGAKAQSRELPVAPAGGVPFPFDLAVNSLADGPARLTIAGSDAKGPIKPHIVTFYHRRSI